MAIRKGTTVRWKKGSTYQNGKVEKSFTGTVTLPIKGVMVTRHGSKENRVLLVKAESGEEELKLLCEVERVKAEF
ncbi:HVA1 family protein [Cytophagaceae bacterium ABcell3]|nr:HVA1 family protein [Cytophagaceae bacterium ABcell3]